ncbi:MAG: ester cyclase [Fuerstiella sp.]|mgnify:CR=1 FL=1
MQRQSTSSNGDSVFVDGLQLRELRRSLRWTQEQAAEEAGYTDRLIRKLERGGPVNVQTLKDVVEAYVASNAGGMSLAAETFIRGQTRSMMESLARQWLERIFNKREIEAINELVAPNAMLLAEGATHVGSDAIRVRVQTILKAFNPLKMTIEKVLVDGDSTVVYWMVKKKHIAEFLGIPATNRWVKLHGSSHARFENNQIIEARDHWDIHDVIQQQTRPSEAAR